MPSRRKAPFLRLPRAAFLNGTLTPCSWAAPGHDSKSRSRPKTDRSRRRMALVQAVLTRPKRLPLAEERRRFQRVRVNVLGRYMLPDRREYPCQVANMSPGGMALIVPVSGQEGERVIAYIDHLGRLEGKIARLYQNGFAMTV